MLHNPQVAWVGVSDLWWESMVTLERVLGVPVLEYALSVYSRMRPNTFKVFTQTYTEDDYGYLLSLETSESLFVEVVGREVRHRATVQEP